LDDTGTELDDTTIYERQPVTWDIAADGTMTPSADITFQVPSSGDELNPTTVSRFSLFDGATGGTDYGGKDVQIMEYVSDGQFTLPMDKILVSFSNMDVSV
jgi:hypothetical protein